MVKKKGKSKRSTLKDKYKIQRRVTETHRKQKKQAKRDAANGVIRHDKKKKDPGIPNSWPFKQDLLKEIQRTREKQQQMQEESKERKKSELRALREHQKQGGQARTIQEMLEQAQQDQQQFQQKSGEAGLPSSYNSKQKSDGAVAMGQQSRRAYLRELKKVVDSADILLQVLDARDPISSRIHPSMEDAILSRADKKMVLILNKIDLVPKDVVGAWLTTLRRSHPTIAIKAGIRESSQGRGKGGDDDDTIATTSTLPVGMEGLLQLLKNYARTNGLGGKSKTTIVCGVIGYPNVGKSSIINALKRTRAVGVSPRPGFTTSMQEVVLDRNVRLLDSPGVVFDDKSAMLGNCVDAESMEDPIPAVSALLQRCNHESLLMTYNIPNFAPGDTMMFLAMVARSHGRVLKGGIPDKIAAARLVLKDWNTGKIPYFTVPPKDAAAPEKSDDAVIVSSFGKAFDLSRFDDAVLSSLQDRDEMDFVQLKDDANDSAGTTTAGSSEKWKEAADFMMRDDSSDEGHDVEMEVDQQPTAHASLAEAEDYDFDDM